MCETERSANQDHKLDFPSLKTLSLSVVEEPLELYWFGLGRAPRPSRLSGFTSLRSRLDRTGPQHTAL